MIIQLSDVAVESEIDEVHNLLSSYGYSVNRVQVQSSSYIIALGKRKLDLRRVGALSAVADVFRVSDSFKLVSRKWRVTPSSIPLGEQINIGEDRMSLVMGPCSIESKEQIELTIDFLSKFGVKIVRGGAFKPRSSPYSFQGLGLEGLKMCADIIRSRAEGGKLVSEVLEPAQIEPMRDFVDVYQVGARNSQNFSLLKELGKCGKPVLLKRGISGTVEELLNAAEYIFAAGNEQIILCERGIRTFETAYRNTTDVNAVVWLKARSHLPVFLDPSHAVGIRGFVESISLAGVMAGADGLLIEMHPEPDKAYSDAAQTLSFPQSARLIRKVREAFLLRKQLDEYV